jgi:hypothetical protein
MGQEKLILHQNKTIFWQQMSHFNSCEDNCYQNCKVIVTKNLGEIIILQWMKNDLITRAW